MAFTCCGRKLKCYSRRLCGEWEPEYESLRNTSVLLFTAGGVGLFCATCAIAMFPFQPAVNSGSLCMFGGALSCTTALVTLCCYRGTQRGAYHASLLCMVIQLLCTASLVYAGAGASFDFCSSTVDCYGLRFANPDLASCWTCVREDWDSCDLECFDAEAVQAGVLDQCRKADTGPGTVLPYRKNCWETKAFQCFDRPHPNKTYASLEGPLTYQLLGERNCEPRYSKNGKCGDPSARAPQPFWGFEDRETCWKYYKGNGPDGWRRKYISPKASTAFVCVGALTQILASFFFMFVAGARLEM
jgi:hypothetical protein